MTISRQYEAISNRQAVKGAVLYDFFQVPGGAEKVIVELANKYLADVVVGFDRVGRSNPFELVDDCALVSLKADASFLPLRIFRLIHAFSRRTRFLDDYSWIVYSGSYAPLAVSSHKTGKNILYCQALPRFIYDLNAYYKHRYRGFQAPIFSLVVKILKPRYEYALSQMDCIVANSENVRGRIQEYLGKESAVIHPPCAVEDYKWIGQDGYYLSTARLEPYKRVDRVIEAFKQMPDKELVVASGGSDAQQLKALAADAKNIRFTGWLDEIEVKKLVGGAIASIYVPMDEDFGMSPVESMAAGKPVIGVAEGGLLETVVSGETGFLVSANLTTDELIDAVERMTPDCAREMRSACEARAQLFSREAFFQKIQNIIGAKRSL